METVCPNPGCGTAYSITPQHLGRQFACRCGAVLIARADGLHMVGPAPGNTAAATAIASTATTTTAPPVERPARKQPAREPGGSILDILPADIFTGLFAAGAVLTVFFLFLPLIDRAKVSRRSAQVEAGELALRRESDAMRHKEQAGGKPTSAEQEAWKKKREDWDKEKVSLQADVEEARVDASKWNYWYMWGMMFGFAALSVASIGLLSPTQSRTRRVVGAIVITAMLLLIFIAFVIGSVGAKL